MATSENSSKKPILLVYSLKGHHQLAGARVANRDRRVMDKKSSSSVDTPKNVGHLHVDAPFGEGGSGHTGGIFGDGTDRLWMHRHSCVLQKAVLDYLLGSMQRR